MRLGVRRSEDAALRPRPSSCSWSAGRSWGTPPCVVSWRDDLGLATVSGRLILLCGLAGAGKTTLAKQLEADGVVRMCPDEWLVALGFDIHDKDARVAIEDLQWELSQALVLGGVTVVDECGVWQRWERDLRRMWARDHGIPVELRFLDETVEVLTARVAERNRALPDGAPRIDPALVAFWDDRIERPDADELALFDRPTESRPERGRSPTAHRTR